MDLRTSFRVSGAAVVYVIDAALFGIPPWHKHDLIVAFLFMLLALYECGFVRSAHSASDSSGKP